MSRYGHSPLHLLYGQGRRAPQVGAGGFNPANFNAASFNAALMKQGGAHLQPHLQPHLAQAVMNQMAPAMQNMAQMTQYGGGDAVSRFGGTREDRIRYLQAAALAGQIPQIFLGVRAVVNPTPAGSAYICSPQTSVPLLVTRFEFEDDIAVFLDVSSFKITRVDMIAGSDPIAGTTFKGDSTAPPIEDPVLPAGVSMTIAGTNNDSNAHTIRGTLRGIDLTQWLDWLNHG